LAALSAICLLWLASGRPPQAKKKSISPFSSPKELQCRRPWLTMNSQAGGGAAGRRTPDAETETKTESWVLVFSV
jgi:hypothetical protein